MALTFAMNDILVAVILIPSACLTQDLKSFLDFLEE